MGWERDSEYFSGQGVVLVGLRDSLGRVRGLRPVGNVTALAISTAINYTEHKESQSGDRATDRKKANETNVTYSATWEDFGSENLMLLLRAERVSIAQGSVVDLPVLGEAGLVTPLEHVMVSNVVVKKGATTLTAYVNEATPYDYEVNEKGGSIKLNSASDKLGVSVTDVTVGATTAITVDDASGFIVGEAVTLSGVTGAGASSVNGVSTKVVSIAGAVVTVGLNTTGKTIVGTGAKLLGGAVALTVSYEYEAQVRLEALTAKDVEVFTRYEGLNTAETGEPVVVDIFRTSIDPLSELALISDDFQSASVEGTVLIDNTRKTGSKYYTVRKVDKPIA